MKKNTWFNVTLVILIISLLFVVFGCSPSATPSRTPSSPTTVSTPASKPTTAAPTTTTTPAPSPSAQPKPAAAQQIKIGLESWLPNVHAGFPATQKYFKGLEAATGGAVTTEYYMAGVMGKPADTYNRVLTGVADVGHFAPGYTPGLFPVFQMLENPIRSPSCETMIKSVVAMYKKGTFDKDFANVKVIGFSGVSPYVLFTTNKKVTTVDQLKGLKIRCPNDGWTNITKALGAVPVTMPSGEVYSSMQKGVMDGSWWIWEAAVTDKIGEVAKYEWDVRMGYFAHVYAMNKDKYNALPQTGKDYIEKNWEAFSLEAAKANDDREVPGRKNFMDQPGRETNNPTPEEWANMEKAVSPLWDKWITDNEKAGVPAKKAAADLYQVMTDLKVDKPLIGYTPGK